MNLSVNAGEHILEAESRCGAYTLLTSLHTCAAPAPCQPRVRVPHRAALAVPLNRW